MADAHPLVRIETVSLVAIGGFVGATLRYFVGTLSPGLVGTLVANVLGSFVLGFVMYEAMYTGVIDEKTRVLGATGLLSSFTTYSTFAVETVQTTPLFGVLNVVGSYALGFSAVTLGRFVAASIGGR